MTRRTNARIVGIAYLLYIAVAFPSMLLSDRATAGSDIAAKVVTIAQHAADIRLTVVLSMVGGFCALVLGVTLYAITRDEDRDLAMLGLTCRVVEAIPGQPGAIFFAVGSTLFCWLLLRGRMIPVALARLGVVASVALVAILVLQRAGLFSAGVNWFSGVTWLVWLPMLVFELALAAWLIVKGVAAP